MSDLTSLYVTAAILVALLGLLCWWIPRVVRQGRKHNQELKKAFRNLKRETIADLERPDSVLRPVLQPVLDEGIKTLTQTLGEAAREIFNPPSARKRTIARKKDEADAAKIDATTRSYTPPPPPKEEDLWTRYKRKHPSEGAMALAQRIHKEEGIPLAEALLKAEDFIRRERNEG